MFFWVMSNIGVRALFFVVVEGAILKMFQGLPLIWRLFWGGSRLILKMFPICFPFLGHDCVEGMCISGHHLGSLGVKVTLMGVYFPP